jgi:hypothetical protein
VGSEDKKYKGIEKSHDSNYKSSILRISLVPLVKFNFELDKISLYPLGAFLIN